MGEGAKLRPVIALLPDFQLAFLPKQWVSYHFIYCSTVGDSFGSP